MSAVLDAVAGGRGQVVPALSVTFPGLSLLASTMPFTSAAGGHFVGKVISWGSLDYAISDRSGRLSTVETRIQVSDTDRSIARVVAGSSADSVRGSAAVIYLGEPSVAFASWLTVFSGVVARVSFPSPFVAEITLRVNDDQLQRLSPRGGWALTRQAWPNAKAEIFDHKFAPVLYGTHDASYTQTGPGLVPALYVDTINHRYLVCAGKAKSLTRVYVDGVQVSASSYGNATGGTPTDGAFDYVTRDGRLYSCITFTADQGDAAVVTCDAQGYATTYGGGTLMTNPATQWAHRLSNFVLDDWFGNAAYKSTHALIDSTSLSAAETYFTSLGALGSDYDDERRTGLDIIARFCDSWRMRAYWTLAGKVGIGYENPFAQPYTGTRWRWGRDETGPLTLSEDDFRVTSRILVSQARSASQGSYLTNFEVMDASVSSDNQGTLDLELSEAK